MDEPIFENVLNPASSGYRPQQPGSELVNRQLRQLLESLIDELPGAFRTVFMLWAVEHCPVATTAEIMGIEPARVKARYQHARLLLQERMMEYSNALGFAVHECTGHRCDTIVCNVLEKLHVDD
ncbi:MAG TPA: sigma factor-like helix-turn-helix DNA-binding protein [Woeseiaceae bacterium]|nr:sigma factor-like helix-turn-helix DNA-binding protein [Woeseiaceae bacterium]